MTTTLQVPATVVDGAVGSIPLINVGKVEQKQSVQAQVLSTECSTVPLSASHTAVICKSIPETMTDKFLVVAPSVVMSLVALVLAGWSLFYNVRKDSLLRDLSVKDDYWLRKIVSPASIEPFVLLSSIIIAELPELHSGGASDEEIKAWYDQQHTAFIRLKPGFKTLELLDGELLIQVEEQLRNFEDELATYIGAVRLHQKDGSPMPVRAATAAKLSKIRVVLLRSIQVHQTSLGKKVGRHWSLFMNKK